MSEKKRTRMEELWHHDADRRAKNAAYMRDYRKTENWREYNRLRMRRYRDNHPQYVRKQRERMRQRPREPAKPAPSEKPMTTIDESNKQFFDSLRDDIRASRENINKNDDTLAGPKQSSEGAEDDKPEPAV